MSDDSPLDLSSLDPGVDRRRFERSIGTLMAAASAELGRRRQPLSILGQIAWWERPTLIAAGILGLAALSTLALVEKAGVPTAVESVWTTSVGVPSPLSGWVEGGETPSVEAALGFPLEAP